MFNKLFKNKNNDITVHCEITGQECSLEDTSILLKVETLIVFNNLLNARIDIENKMIISDDKPPLKYYSEVNIPDDLIELTGRLFTIVEDEEDLEQTTSILSKEGKRLFTGNRIMPLIEHIKNGIELLRFPETFFFAVIIDNIISKELKCDNWEIDFNSIEKKYRYKKIILEKRKTEIYGTPSFLIPGFDIAISDCSNKNPNGNSYMFATDKNFIPVNLCCNESAVDYCVKNNCLIFYNDFLNKGNLRVLSPYTVNINKNLQNKYLYRTSNF